MEINGKIIKGIFVYDAEVKYTEGDFVVEDNSMYVCGEASIGNLPSTSPDYFKPYLGAPTAEEEISDSSNSFVSSYTLGKFLSQAGTCNVKGVIPNIIEENRNAYFRDFFGNESGLSLEDKYLDPLDNLIVSPDEGLRQIAVDVDKSVTESLMGTCQSNPLLRQYTYRDNNKYTRVQELINVDTGDTYFRTSSKIGNLEDDYPWSAPTEWKNVSVNGTFRDTLTQIKAYYRQKCADLEIYKTKLIGAFRYKIIKVYQPGETAGISTASPEFYNTDGIITLCLREEKDGIVRTENVTVDLNSPELNKYHVMEDKILTISKENGGRQYIFNAPGLVIYSMYVRIPFSYGHNESNTEEVVIPVIKKSGNGSYFLDTKNIAPGLQPLSHIKVEIKGVSSFVFPATESNISIGRVTVTSAGSSGFYIWLNNSDITEDDITEDDITAAYVKLDQNS